MWEIISLLHAVITQNYPIKHGIAMFVFGGGTVGSHLSEHAGTRGCSDN